jgi:hypothetical protein
MLLLLSAGQLLISCSSMLEDIHVTLQRGHLTAQLFGFPHSILRSFRTYCFLVHDKRFTTPGPVDERVYAMDERENGVV